MYQLVHAAWLGRCWLYRDGQPEREILGRNRPAWLRAIYDRRPDHRNERRSGSGRVYYIWTWDLSVDEVTQFAAWQDRRKKR